ncbi:MAG: AgmX/PglI C-terminal domain-containing protein [Myxococcota bacterium]
MKANVLLILLIVISSCTSEPAETEKAAPEPAASKPKPKTSPPTATRPSSLPAATSGSGEQETASVSQGEETPVFSKEQINASLEDFREDIRDCYDKARERDSDLEGKVRIQWTVEADGSVKEVSAEDIDLGSKNVERCLERFLESVKFPKPDDPPAIVSETITFRRPD